MSTSHGNPSTLQALYALGAETFDSSLSITAEQFVANVEPLAPGFGRLIVEMEFGAIYNRPGLDIKTRELIIIASCAALGATGLGAVKMHIPAALRHGATRAQIVESLVQVSMAAGLPTALGALQAASEVFAELDANASPN
ncbi:carboxymuconolactone decarboxylase family protein [Pseudomonas sp. SDO5522_S412]|uniref:Carboxymuconolactone decarboxylase family protein n=1 Tax=Pseudomonas synxantha TaxID=47883 RepID=A0AAX3I9E4_9PSED|nr:carboxymuconolactone decarboxylase family protein [Pseudomonas synxantha]SDU43961.1 4-carboxymuconolactone decarboxylase [Pseudomonas synxantha]VTR02208.1 carboxymuconolactone decarboxylase family protein [Pseudomonas synxantha]